VISLWLPVAAWMAAIWYGAGMSQVPGAVASISDTILHAFGYTVLTLLLVRALAGGKARGVTTKVLLLALVISTLHGMSVEWEQMYIPSRMSEWRDVGNDVIGGLVGVMLAAAWSKIRG
jgi:VanZ family protein